jgi:hypothetical protein
LPELRRPPDDRAGGTSHRPCAPAAPVRQWVLSLPFELRYRLAWDHELCRAVLAVYTRALLGFYRKRAEASGHRNGRTGTVTVIQRFGGALNLNVHFHTLAVDGVFVREPDGSLGFAASKAPTDEEVELLLGLIRKRVLRLLVRRGLLSEEPGESLDETEAPPLHALYAASVRQRVAMGRRAGGTVLRLGDAPTVTVAPPKRRRQARLGGFDLHADTSVRGKNRPKLERLCRYLLGPPVAEDRLAFAPDGGVLVRLKTPWRYGTPIKFGMYSTASCGPRNRPRSRSRDQHSEHNSHNFSHTPPPNQEQTRNTREHDPPCLHGNSQ